MSGAGTFVAQPGRLDVEVARALDVPRAEAQRAIDEGRVLVEGRARPKSFRLAGGETVEASVRAAGDLPVEHDPVVVRYEDDHLMVVAKPAGLPVHPTAARRDGTLVNRLLGMGVPLSSGGDPDRPGIVHRLDAGTSGLMVVAKDDATHETLSAMFRRHDVDRRYLALVRGRIADHVLIDAPLERRGARVVARQATGRGAATEVGVRERFERATLVEARPRTGRTHQIRVHLSSAGHPIIGDRRYGGGGGDADRLGLTRPFLHSWRVAFDHPVTGERVEVDEPLPPDLQRALDRVRAAT
ncbi:MAG TPA: RluA family pseudouridine synthase [Actinomycetota bacterium]|nr:RluA family pseudouridine synthase [Actinomycetota bacterium]